ncbi:PREDICTED: dedicator of cytokinesis protein 9-like [Priapulus caudatus]|uniref:Dedicator of cytokinesis protein 9-like n=1 Tax=Priapulus caudatus TaxID=37621 RepID=A0ABM1E3C4_PRICU|nr:PREDICTED: dedicator of cytokinesis protein 9-like [Priapulus caudatus]
MNKSVTKSGYLCLSPDRQHDAGRANLSMKSFKKRFFYLKQQVDTSYVMEYHKDDKKLDAKGLIYLDSLVDVVKNPKRGKLVFELRMQDRHNVLLLADNEQQVDSWIATLKRVIDSEKRDALGANRIFEEHIPSPGKAGSLHESLRQSMNPELQKYARETDASIAEDRQQGRQRLFKLYRHEMQKNSVPDEYQDEMKIDTYSERFGLRLLIKCENLSFRLLVSLQQGDRFNQCQAEPYFCTLALYDVRDECKISEDFHFDINDPRVRDMIPKDVQMAPEMLNANAETNSSQPDIGNLNEDWLQFRNQAIFSVRRPHPDIYMVVRVEKVLHGSLAQSAEPYISKSNDSKQAFKVYKQMTTVCQRLGHYRMPFAWAARPLLKPFTQEINTYSEFLTIYRQDATSISDADLMKYLSYIKHKRTDKLSKLQAIPGNIKISVEELKVTVARQGEERSGQQMSQAKEKATQGVLPNCLTPSLKPVKPFPEPPTHPVSYEVEEFLPDFSTSFPHTTYINNLYVYPIHLKYDTQKCFTKARNIACVIEFKDSDSATSAPLKRIYGRPGMPAFVTTTSAAVLHHSTTPDMYEEVKVALPLQLHSKHHILFRFFHVSCELPKSSMKKKDNVETAVGYAWLPILQNNVVTVGEHSICVAQELPAGYLTSDPQSFGKGYAGPIIKWVDNSRPVFKASLRLLSTVYTKDVHLQKFFSHCEKLEDSADPVDKSETVNLVKPKTDMRSLVEFASGDFHRELANSVKVLHAVEISTIIRFLPPTFNQLFRLLAACASDDVSQNTIRLLIHVVQGIHAAGKPDILHTYVKHVFMTTPVSGGQKTIHEELCKNLTVALRPANADLVLINSLLEHAWFFLQIIVKSMAQYLLVTGRLELPRNERFSSDFQFRVLTMVQAFLQHIMQKFKEHPVETRSANASLANFVKGCFTFMDRGFVMKIVNLYLDKFDPSGAKALYEFRFEFVKIVCSHEHYVALNLPMVRTNAVRNIKDLHLDFTLTDEFRKYHFLAGVLLLEVRSALREYRDVRRVAIAMLRNQLAKHAFDDRFSSRLCSICDACHGQLGYWMALESSLIIESRSSTLPPGIKDPAVLALIAGGSLGNQGRSSSMANMSDRSSNASTATLQDREGSEPPDDRSDKIQKSQAVQSAPLIRYDKLERDEVRDMHICFLYILENISAELLLGWWQKCSESEILDFFKVLEMCLTNFSYPGRKQIYVQQAFAVNNPHQKALTLPSRRAPNLTSRVISTYSDRTSALTAITEEMDSYTALLTASMATEVGLIILDTVALFATSFKEQLQQGGGDNQLMLRMCDICLLYLQMNQSEALLKHLFAFLRNFVNQYKEVLFEGNASLCGAFITEILHCCNSKLRSTRVEACALLYLLMRNNFEFTGRRNFTRVHLQAIISVSQLLGDAVGLNNARFQESLSNINNYANTDKAIQHTPFPAEVKDLTKRIRTVLMATAQMKEHENDPEMLVDLQHSLANSYASTPELRHTWLENMARIHGHYGNLSEVAHCYMHIAALVAEYLKRKGVYSLGCSAFVNMSPNISVDESNMKEDAGSMQDISYTEDTLVEKLEMCAYSLDKAERWEMMGEVYKLIIPIYEKQRNYQAISEAYGKLHQAYSKVVDVLQQGKRLLGTFFRVAFYGQHFDMEDGKEYIYKEPKVTNLAEISERLRNLYSEKYGKDTVKLIQDSNPVDPTELDPKFAYIQISFVRPFFKDQEGDERITDFERNNNIRHFVYETPFIPNSKKAHGLLEEQCKRRTILTTLHSFPYVKKRVPVFGKEVVNLAPLEVAIDEMHNRVCELNEVLLREPHDMIKLQLRLQGSVSVQVHAGPLAYANTFLGKEMEKKYDKEHIKSLKEAFRAFVHVCGDALELNAKLIGAEQAEYHESMKNNYNDMVEKLSALIENLYPTETGMFVKELPLQVFNYISTSSTV